MSALAETLPLAVSFDFLTAWDFWIGVGVLVVASTGSLTPNTGFQLLLAMFAAVILGGIGNAYGALAGGLVLGLSQEWSTLVIAAQWKIAVSFAVLILVLVFRPQGIFGSARTL